MTTTSVEQLLATLRRKPQSSAPEVAAALGVSVPTAQRLLRTAGDAVVSLGRARRTRHAARRSLRGQAQDLPVYRIDAEGIAHAFATLALVAPQGCAMALQEGGWPLPDASRDGWWPGLPYPLQDMRPQGYLGRQFARAVHDDLQLPPDPRAWGDDEVLLALAHAGHDMPGDLVVGERALRLWQAQRLAAPPALTEERLLEAYAALAELALAGGAAGSSAAGEFPKFAALRSLPLAQEGGPDGVPRSAHVLVKFSGAGVSPAERRWADLLRAEHLALQTLAEHGVPAARSRILTGAGRTFLEVERFDRHGLWGRSPLVSLEAVNAAFLGQPQRSWAVLGAGLVRLDVLSDPALQHIARLEWFGRLIGNTDMHLGNLGFRPRADGFSPAPAYDMLPMRYAPLPGGELPALRPLDPALPLPAERSNWQAAADVAMAFWQQLADDVGTAQDLRALAGTHAGQLTQLRAVVG